MMSAKFEDFVTPSSPFVCNSRNLSVLFIHKLRAFSNPPSPPQCGRRKWMSPKGSKDKRARCFRHQNRRTVTNGVCLDSDSHEMCDEHEECAGGKGGKAVTPEWETMATDIEDISNFTQVVRHDILLRLHVDSGSSLQSEGLHSFIR